MESLEEPGELRQLGDPEQREAFGPSQERASIAIMSGKGGVGKTTTTLNLAAAVAQLGQEAVMLDLDMETTNLSLELGYRSGGEINIQDLLDGDVDENMMAVLTRIEERLGLLPSALNREDSVQRRQIDWEPDQLRGLLQQLGRWAFLDTPPGINDEHVKIMQSVDSAIVVMNPSESSFADGMKTVSLARDQDVDVLGAVINRADESRYDLTVDEMSDYLQDIGVLGVIPEDKRVRKTRTANRPIVHAQPYAPAAIAYLEIASKLTGSDYRRPHAVKRLIGRIRA